MKIHNESFLWECPQSIAVKHETAIPTKDAASDGSSDQAVYVRPGACCTGPQSAINQWRLDLTQALEGTTLATGE